MVRSTRYFSFATWQMRMLSSSSPVTAMTRSAREIPARSRTQSSDASPYCTLCSSSCSTARKRSRSDSSRVTSCPLSSSSRARFQPTFPAPTMITYIRSLIASGASFALSWKESPLGSAGRRLGSARLLRGGRPDLPLEHVDRDLRRANGVDALALVPVGSQRVEDPGDDLWDVVAALRDLRDHDVRVVAVGGVDERVRAFDR